MKIFFLFILLFYQTQQQCTTCFTDFDCLINNTLYVVDSQGQPQNLYIGPKCKKIDPLQQDQIGYCIDCIDSTDCINGFQCNSQYKQCVLKVYCDSNNVNECPGDSYCHQNRCIPNYYDFCEDFQIDTVQKICHKTCINNSVCKQNAQCIDNVGTSVPGYCCKNQQCGCSQLINSQPLSGLCQTKIYKNGELLTGFYDFANNYGTYSQDGKLYEQGLPLTGVFEQQQYKNGSLLNGFLKDLLYEQGVLFTGFYSQNNLLYVNGTIFSGNYTDNKQYQNGSLFTGEINGTFYNVGNLQEGFINTRYFEKGQPYNGTHVSDKYGNYSQKLYQNGYGFNGTYIDDQILYFYKDGFPYDGFDENQVYYQKGRTFNGTLQTDNRYYENGIQFTGILVTDSNKRYDKGLRICGIFTDGLVYQNGSLLTGIFNCTKNIGNVNADQLKYTNGIKDVPIPVPINNNVLPKYDPLSGKIKIGPALFTGIYNGSNIVNVQQNVFYYNGEKLQNVFGSFQFLIIKKIQALQYQYTLLFNNQYQDAFLNFINSNISVLCDSFVLFQGNFMTSTLYLLSYTKKGEFVNGKLERLQDLSFIQQQNCQPSSFVPPAQPYFLNEQGTPIYYNNKEGTLRLYQANSLTGFTGLYNNTISVELYYNGYLNQEFIEYQISTTSFIPQRQLWSVGMYTDYKVIFKSQYFTGFFILEDKYNISFTNGSFDSVQNAQILGAQTGYNFDASAVIEEYLQKNSSIYNVSIPYDVNKPYYQNRYERKLRNVTFFEPYLDFNELSPIEQTQIVADFYNTYKGGLLRLAFLSSAPYSIYSFATQYEKLISILEQIKTNKWMCILSIGGEYATSFPSNQQIQNLYNLYSKQIVAIDVDEENGIPQQKYAQIMYDNFKSPSEVGNKIPFIFTTDLPFGIDDTIKLKSVMYQRIYSKNESGVMKQYDSFISYAQKIKNIYNFNIFVIGTMYQKIYDQSNSWQDANKYQDIILNDFGIKYENNRECFVDLMKQIFLQNYQKKAYDTDDSLITPFQMIFNGTRNLYGQLVVRETDGFNLYPSRVNTNNTYLNDSLLLTELQFFFNGKYQQNFKAQGIARTLDCFSFWKINYDYFRFNQGRQKQTNPFGYIQQAVSIGKVVF